MSKHTKTGLIIAVILLLVLGVYFLFKDDHADENGSSGSITTMEFSNIELKEDQEGKPIWRLKAKHVIMSKDKNSADMEGLDGYFIKDGNKLAIKADKGTYSRKEQKVYIEGHVEGESSDGLILHAENLSYDGKKQVLSTDKFFTAEKDGRVLTADSFTGDRVLEKMTAKGHAKLADKEEEQ